MATFVKNSVANTLKLDNTTSSPALAFESFELPPSNQRVLGAPFPKGTVTPLALRPTVHSSASIELDTVIKTIKSLQEQNGLLAKKLAQHGTLLFRSLPIHNAEDFSKFAHAFGYHPHEIIGIVVNRPVLAPNVAPVSANFSTQHIKTLHPTLKEVHDLRTS